MNGRRNKFS